jgi:hypothetical protein
MKRPVPTVALHMQYKTSFLVADKIWGEEKFKDTFSETFLSFFTLSNFICYQAIICQVMHTS